MSKRKIQLSAFGDGKKSLLLESVEIRDEEPQRQSQLYELISLLGRLLNRQADAARQSTQPPMKNLPAAQYWVSLLNRMAPDTAKRAEIAVSNMLIGFMQNDATHK